MNSASSVPSTGSEPVASDSNPVVAAVTVTYNPDIGILCRQLAQLPPQSLKVWVDNASDSALLDQLRTIAAQRHDVVLLLNDVNLGLAAALNQGAHAASHAASDCPYLILLDQDTEPGEGGVEALLAAFKGLLLEHPRLGCVGPKLIDVQTGLEHGFHQISGCRWVRRYKVAEPSLPVANLNGSGTLLKFELFKALSGLDSDFFIDHVDTEWSFRVLHAGYELLGIPGVAFKHRMGERSIRFWLFGWRLWPYRSPKRHFYLFRNTIRLMLRPGVPICWKIWAPVKLAATLVVHLFFDDARWAQLRGMVGGLRAALMPAGSP